MSDILNNLANGLVIGESTINLVNTLANLSCNGGLFKKTTNKGYRYLNTTNNFDGGTVGRYGYSTQGNGNTDYNITYNPFYALKSDGKTLEQAKTVGDSIGDAYYVGNTTNSGLHFKTTENFEEIGKKLRQINVGEFSESFRNNKYIEYADKFVPKDKLLGGAKSIGDILGVLAAVRYTYNKNDILKEYYKDENSSLYKFRNEVLLQGKNAVKVDNASMYENISSSNEVMQGSPVELKVGKYHTDSNIYSKRIKYRDTNYHFYNEDRKFTFIEDKAAIQNLGDFYESVVDTDVKTNGWINVSEIGIYEYTKKKGYLSKNINGRTYSSSSQYAVDSKNDDTYIEDVSSLPKFTEVIVKNQGSGTIAINKSTERKTYSYYEEPDGKNKDVKNILKTDSAFNDSVTLTSFNSSSKLLQKTNSLFTNHKISSLINRFHTESSEALDYDLITSYSAKYGMSRGRNLLKSNHSSDDETGYNNPYCRVWTAHHQYSKLKDRIRPFIDGNTFSDVEDVLDFGALRPAENGSHRLNEYSVLENSGFVRISSTNDGTSSNETMKDNALKRYMFSIENLAWKDNLIQSRPYGLSNEQIGPNGGRIMWFPPYNLKFSENVSTQWQSHDFIGRGEKIYTYTNTERSGTLDFTLLIDHPSVINKWAGTGSNSTEEMQQELLRFFAGCGTLEGGAVDPTPDYKKEGIDDEESVDPRPNGQTIDIAYVMFFSNDFSGKDIRSADAVIEEFLKYERDKSNNPLSAYTTRDQSYKDEILGGDNNNNYSIYALNTSSGVTENNSLIKAMLFNGQDDITVRSFEELLNVNDIFADDGTIDGTLKVGSGLTLESISLMGFASSHGYEKNNEELCKRRRAAIEKVIKEKASSVSDDDIIYEDGSIISVDQYDTNGKNVNTIGAKIARAATAIFHFSYADDTTPTYNTEEGNNYVVQYAVDEEYNDEEYTTQNEASLTQNISEGNYYYDNEYLYFSSLKNPENNMIYKNIVDKIRVFNPAFHSITPEGFNARLTFLHQCTRQGPTEAVSNGNTDSNSADYLKYAGNLAFGRAPYCVLRIGDFFNTKIIIDSVSISYDNNGISWDLNPEGAGVQPMFANVTVGFKFLGGQDISGPIERLQNAVTYNFYANASVYDVHADTNEGYYDAVKATKVVYPDKNESE